MVTQAESTSSKPIILTVKASTWEELFKGLSMLVRWQSSVPADAVIARGKEGTEDLFTVSWSAEW